MKRNYLALFLAIFTTGSALAGTPIGNINAGKDKAGSVCAACHGADGSKTLDGSYPMLAGQYADYLSKVLHDYKSGKRQNPIMGAQAQALSEQDIADVSAYFGSLSGQVHDLSSHER